MKANGEAVSRLAASNAHEQLADAVQLSTMAVVQPHCALLVTNFNEGASR